MLQTGSKVRDEQDQQWPQLLLNECACKLPQRLSHNDNHIGDIYALIIRESYDLLKIITNEDGGRN